MLVVPFWSLSQSLSPPLLLKVSSWSLEVTKEEQFIQIVVKPLEKCFFIVLFLDTINMVNHELHYKNTSFMPKHSVGGNYISFITLVTAFKMFSNKLSFCQNCLDAVVARNLLENL